MSLKNLICNLNKSLNSKTNLQFVCNMIKDYNYSDWTLHANNKPEDYEKK